MDNSRELDTFLASVEKKAYCHAEFATKQTEDALDIVQETMLAFVRRYANKPKDEWPALFHRILQNQIRDWFRRSTVRSRWRSWFGGDADEHQHQLQNQPAKQSGEPIKQLQGEEIGDGLVSALKQLPSRQQQAFLLRVWEGLSVKETADAMSCSDGSVKTHLSRATSRMRDLLEDY
ncbi:MAG: RNA polymerase sigma factor [Piscirickettsiaceae bacterium]|nr:MAG: RNA polymerase sigma factor [Piscirickettsiaceae bacterium]